MSQNPKGRPPKTKSILYKIREESHDERNKERDDIQVPVPREEVPEVVRNERPEKEEPKYDPIPEEKKPRTEKQINAFHKMMEARKQKITIKEKPEIKEVKEVKPEPDMMKMMSELHERMNQIQNPVKEKKQKAVKEKKQVVVLEKPKPKPKPKKRVMKEETSDEEESEEEESESEDEDDAYVKKYTQKAEKRFHAVKQIEQRLQQIHKPQNRYSHLSIF